MPSNATSNAEQAQISEQISVKARPAVVGIVNVTPDSFADGGRFRDPGDALEHARKLTDDGADLLDIGGESTRPGSLPVTADEQWARIGSVVTELAKRFVPISVDTQLAEVARRSLEAGANIINDVSAGRTDPELMAVVAQFNASVILMHMQGRPRTMQDTPQYEDCTSEVLAFLLFRRRLAHEAGIPAENIWIDPGIGFGKRLHHNVELLRNLDRFVAVGAPVLVGTSRKTFIGHVVGVSVDRRLPGSLASLVPAVQAGVHAVRVHDVAATVQFLDVLARVN